VGDLFTIGLGMRKSGMEKMGIGKEDGYMPRVALVGRAWWVHMSIAELKSVSIEQGEEIN
jgi:hypothetical protein